MQPRAIIFVLIEGSTACRVWGIVWSSELCDSRSAPCPVTLSLDRRMQRRNVSYTGFLSPVLSKEVHLLMTFLTCTHNTSKNYFWSIKKKMTLEFRHPLLIPGVELKIEMIHVEAIDEIVLIRKRLNTCNTPLQGYWKQHFSVCSTNFLKILWKTHWIGMSCTFLDITERMKYC